MQQVPFSELVDALAGSGMDGSASVAFAIPARAGFFVDPVLAVKEGLDNLAADIILVSARGAAGKTTAAVELAARTGAPLWRLERDSAVGRAALPLKLSHYLNTVDALYEVKTRAARPTLLIDSLDEARAFVSAQSWDEFLDSVIEATEGLRIVLFGRDRTLEEVWLRLSDAGLSTAWLEVSHFSQPSQREYIDGLVEKKNTSLLEGTYYVPAREAVLAALTGAVDDDSADTFVGYAPVLDAVATLLLEEPNHYGLKQEFDSKAGTSRHIEVLREILHGLLLRDQGKLAPVAKDLGLNSAATYTPDEQIDWLWHALAGADEPQLGYIDDEAKRHEYRQQLQVLLDDHPFRSEGQWASVVFEAYATAERLDNGIPAQTLVNVGNHSGLLFDLVAATAPEDGRLIDEWQFAALHASILAGESVGSTATVTASDTDDSLGGRMEVSRPSGFASLEFTLIPESTAEVVLVGPLESLTLSTNRGIRIPPLDNDRVIGSDLYLRCDALQIEGNEAQFARTPSNIVEDGIGARVEVTGTTVVLPSMISVQPTPGSFELSISDDVRIMYPWINYRVPLQVEDDVDPRSRAIRFLSKLQNLARSHGHADGRATFFMKLQGRQSVKATKLRDVLDYLKSAGVVRLEGELVFITAEADEHRFSGKETPGQRTIQQEWEYWGPVVQGVQDRLE